MTFLEEEELFPTITSSDVFATEEVDAIINESEPSTKEIVDGDSEVGKGKQKAKRKLTDMEDAKKVCPCLSTCNAYLFCFGIDTSNQLFTQTIESLPTCILSCNFAFLGSQ